jgi:hypothetical protein
MKQIDYEDETGGNDIDVAFGPEYLGLDGVQAIIQFWSSTFLAVPDSHLVIQKTRTETLPQGCASTICMYTYTGTQVLKLVCDTAVPSSWPIQVMRVENVGNQTNDSSLVLSIFLWLYLSNYLSSLSFHPSIRLSIYKSCISSSPVERCRLFMWYHLD